MVGWLTIILGPAVTVVLGLLAIRRSLPSQLLRLRHDIELLKLAKDVGLPVDGIESSVKQRLARLFPDASEIQRRRSRLINILQLSVFASFILEAGLIFGILYGSYHYLLISKLWAAIALSGIAGLVAFNAYLHVTNYMMMVIPSYQRKMHERYIKRRDAKAARRS